MALDFDVAPYFDDSVENAIPNNYLRILFKPEQAVQARELTALQTILQNQISSLGSFVFQDGSPVSGGHISLDTTVTALALQQQFANVDINLSDFLVGGNATLITDTTGSNVKAVVMAVDPTQAAPTILVKYLTATTFAPGQTIQVAAGVQTQASVAANNASTPATIASISDGIFYSGGFFINVQPQTIVVDSTTNAANARIGLQIQESIITSADDSTLLDPALGSSNYQAPGADRYQYLLVLSTRSFSSTDDSKFYDLLEVQNGLITKQIDYPVFADLDKALAERTYDTNGNFTVRPFGITTAANTANTSNYDIVVSPGKAYVKGFEFHTIGTQRLSVPKALLTNTVNSFGFSLEFGNILTTANLYSGNISGFFSVADFANVDLHVTQTNTVSTVNATTYGATKMGVARLRDVEFLGLGQYFAYITDIAITGNNFIAAAGSTTSITLPAGYVVGANAYANVLVTVNTAGTFDTRTITTYNAGTRVATLDRPLTIAATAASNCTLNYAAKDIDALTITPTIFGQNVYFAQNTSGNTFYASMDVSIGGRDFAGNTIISDTQFNKLIFPLPQNFIAQNTINNATFAHRKNLFSQTFTTGNLTLSSGSGLGTGESFPYGFTGSYLSDTAANTNFLVTIRDKKSSNLANGVVVNWDRNSNPGGNGVFQTDSTHVTIVLGTAATVIGDILLTVQVTNAAQSSVARRTKTLVGNTSNTTLLGTDSYLNGTAVIGSTNANTVWVDSTNAYVWFTSNPDIQKTPGKRMGMGIADVISIIAIYDSGNSSFMPNLTNAIDVTSRYALDSGQRDNYYDHSGLVLQTGNSPPTGQVVALLQFFQHDAVNGFFDADSYAASVYTTEQIPYYNSTKFGTFTLRDCIDFRPTRTPGYTANIQSFTLTGLDLPQPDGSFTLGYQFYMPRIDKFQITKDKNFRVLQGVPNVYPQAPADTDDAMTAFILTVPAFTANVSTIGLQYVENKRYTMRDIGALDTRIQQLEYYSALSKLESQTVNEKILYQDGVTAKDNYGVIADDFGAYSIADVSDPDLQCYMEPGSLGPLKAQWPLSFNFTSNTGNVNIVGKTYCLTFTETPAVQQNAAATFVSVQPTLFGQFKGQMVLSPSHDSYFSANLIPQTTAPAPVIPKPLPEPSAPTMRVYYIAPYAYNVLGGGIFERGVEIEDLSASAYGFYARGGYFYTSTGVSVQYVYNTSLTAYGVVHVLGNWYGKPISPATVTASNTQPYQFGSSIPLASGGLLSKTVAISTVQAGYGLNI
jgi:hypothetical protein